MLEYKNSEVKILVMKKNKYIALALLLFTGLVGGHRFYYGLKSAYVFVLLFFSMFYFVNKNDNIMTISFLILFIWCIVDLFLIILNKIVKTDIPLKTSTSPKADDISICETPFWKSIDKNLYATNVGLCNIWHCPYCNTPLPKRKGYHFKCPNCKNKIHRVFEVISQKDVLFTDTEKESYSKLKDELYNRKRVYEIYKQAKQLLDIELGSDKKENIKIFINAFKTPKSEYFDKHNIGKLRYFYLLEGDLLRFYDFDSSINSFMKILYIDLLGDYNTLYDDKEMRKELLEDIKISKKEIKEYIQNQKEELEYNKKLANLQGGYIDKKYWDIEYPEIDDTLLEWMFVGKNILPFVYECAFINNLHLSEYKNIFIKNAEYLVENFQFEVPITPDKAWDKILKYIKENKNEKEN